MLNERVFHFASELARLPLWAGQVSHVAVAENGKTPARQSATRQSSSADVIPASSVYNNTFTQSWFTKPIQFRRYDMAEVKKQEKDYTKEVEELLPAAQSLAKVRFADWFLNGN